jgi:3-isopropylmalate dehydrogenase
LKANIVLLPGDGIGPEVVAEAVRVLEAVAQRFGHQLSFTERLMGGCSIDRFGAALTDEVLADCRAADAVLLGAVGGPKWDDPSARVRPEQGLLALRKGLRVYANLRPVRVHPSLVNASPLKPERLAGVDILVIRELTGGLYFGQPKGRERVDGHERAVDTLEYHDYEIRRVVELAFRLAERRRRKVTSVDKANVLESSRLWRQVATAAAGAHPAVALEHMLVDTASMRLIASPASFDVLVTENMFGDILTDEASVLAGSMGLLPSASLGDDGPGLYEPIHGSAPDIAGKGVANPLGTILSAALLLRHSLRLEREAAAVEAAVDAVLADGARTADLGGRLGSRDMAAAVLARLADTAGAAAANG